ncbi:MAG: hypothetical protein GY795_42725 [Desulfobacterales bacterium]|nr:hypothetical protein [Desulfobacterales bacterium]
MLTEVQKVFFVDNLIPLLTYWFSGAESPDDEMYENQELKMEEACYQVLLDREKVQKQQRNKTVQDIQSLEMQQKEVARTSVVLKEIDDVRKDIPLIHN